MKPDEIKKGLECCMKSTQEACDNCPYRKYCERFCPSEIFRDALAYIKRMSARNEELHKEINQLRAHLPKWISVEDRLPEDDSNYLCLLTDGFFEVCTYNGVGEWITQDQENFTQFVTHWMQIPQPPKEV